MRLHHQSTQVSYYRSEVEEGPSQPKTALLLARIPKIPRVRVDGPIPSIPDQSASRQLAFHQFVVAARKRWLSDALVTVTSSNEYLFRAERIPIGMAIAKENANPISCSSKVAHSSWEMMFETDPLV